MEIICEIIAGSRLYGLETSESDIDTRGVFVCDDIASIIGINKNEVLKKEMQDTIHFELKHFLSGLRKTNTQMLEMLFADEEDFTFIKPQFLKIKENKFKLMNSDYFYKSLLGYIHNEKRLAIGERTGLLGSKRKNNLDKYGFSPKNFSHLFRLAYCGSVFFETEQYPVNLAKYNKDFRNFIFAIKTEPEKFNKNYLESLVEESIKKLENSFRNRKSNFDFDLNFANELCFELYMPFLKKFENDRK